MNPPPALALIFALLAATLMGTIGVFARFAALPAKHITFYRLLLGALFLMAYMLLTGKGQQIRHKPSKRTLINGAMLAGFMAFYIEAIQYTQMATVIMIIYLAPVVSSVFAHFVFNERLNRFSMASVVLALAGFILMLPITSSQSLYDYEILGYFYALLSLLTYSSFILINRKPSAASPYQSTLVQLSIGALCLLPLVLTTPLLPSLNQFAWLLAIGFFPGFLAILFAVKALSQLTSVTYGTLSYVEPVVVVTLAWWLFYEALTAQQLCGVGLIILAGITQGWLSQRKALKSAEDPSVCHN
ncbi:DMT family transporter [Shewanella sp. KJ2020]|uniref:DMT family transporter n=1 Tax=Shewanella sp. KJ2020 TaxID=2919172 RepID=UPI0020A7D031|nr:EamA family transporter [Shewanella sp. KJ2020]MCP3127718.1 DMT family transporter [Shewanella sp. KJ2020]